MEAIAKAGISPRAGSVHRAGLHSSEFYKGQPDVRSGSGKVSPSSNEMADKLDRLGQNRYPIVSIGRRHGRVRLGRLGLSDKVLGKKVQWSATTCS